MRRVRPILAAAASLLLASSVAAPVTVAATPPSTTTPIQHVVVIFQENVSFDHYFGTYPKPTNPSGEPGFAAIANTPGVNGLTAALLNNNPNLNNPKRLDRSQPITCDMNHDYGPEQLAVDGGKMDKFVQNTTGSKCGDVSVMDYYDGNTVTALWNYAQHFSMSDNSYGTTFGPSTPGALNLVSGQTHGATPSQMTDVIANGTDISDADPAYDDCSAGKTFSMSGKNIGNLLNANNVTWGWFEGGFKPTGSDSSGKAVCGAKTLNVAGSAVGDYSAHHEPFQYYQSTSNPKHLPPSSIAMIGRTDQANHQYDLTDFWSAADAGNMPAVSFLKAVRAQDGHAGYSDPLDEQLFLVNTINHLQTLPTWNSTAVIISYDDSDGWYDHAAPPKVMTSNDPTYDYLCGVTPPGAHPDRCGYGPRLPLMVISPYAKANFVDHTVTDQSSILRFIEDNWQTGRIGDQSFDALAGPLTNLFDFSNRQPAYFLYPDTGSPVAATATAPSNANISTTSTIASGQSVTGTLTGSTTASNPNSIASYSLSGTGAPITITLSYAPGDPNADKAIGFIVYDSQGKVVQNQTETNNVKGSVSYSLGSSASQSYTIQVYNYTNGSSVNYTLTAS